MASLSPARSPDALIEALVARGDLKDLTPAQRAAYYAGVCESLGLNPLTKPFEFLHLGGRLVLYATKGAADQLRAIHGVSLEVVANVVEDGMAVVHVRAKAADGRADEDFGLVSVDGLRGEAYANARLKALTKAKRRATLSLLGLGMLDETEVPSSARAWEEPSRASVSTVEASAVTTTGVALAPGGDAWEEASGRWRAVQVRAKEAGADLSAIRARVGELRELGRTPHTLDAFFELILDAGDVVDGADEAPF